MRGYPALLVLWFINLSLYRARSFWTFTKLKKGSLLFQEMTNILNSLKSTVQILKLWCFDQEVCLGPVCVFYATRCQVYWGLTHNLAFYQSSDLILQTQTHKHTAHSGTSRLTHSCKYIFNITCYVLTTAAFITLND